MLEILLMHVVVTTVLCAGVAAHDDKADVDDIFTLALMWPFLAWAAGVFHLAAAFCWTARKWRGQ